MSRVYQDSSRGVLPRALPLSVEGAREVLDYGGARRPAGPVCSPLVASSRLRRTGRSLVGLQLPACLAAARHLSGWRAVPVRRGSGMCEGSSSFLPSGTEPRKRRGSGEASARMELRSAEAVSSRLLGLSQRYRSQGGGG